MKALKTLGAALDSVANEIAPSWGAKRSSARYRRQMVAMQIEQIERLGYSWTGAAPSHSRDDRYLNSRMSPDEAVEHDLPELRRRCVEQYRSNPIAHSAIEGRVANEVGTGITRLPKVRPDDRITKKQAANINDRLKDICDQWSDHGVDKSRRLSLAALQRLVCRNYATYGEAFVLVGQGPYRGSIGLTLDVISPERVETPPELRMEPLVRMGIRYTKAGAIVGYYVRKSHPDATKGFTIEYDFIRRFDESGHARMLHVFDPLFPEQSRGIPWLATALNTAKDAEDYVEAELINKQLENHYGIIVSGGANAPTPQEVADGNANSIEADGTRLQNLNGVGFVHYEEAGAEVKTVDPQRPGAMFAPFIQLCKRSVAAVLSFPYEILAKDYSSTSFSSGRLSMLDGWKSFAMRQQVIVDQLLRPVWRRLVHDSMFLGLLDGLVSPVDYLERPEAYERHKWQSQGRGYIDPEKEVKADVRSNDAGHQTKANIAGLKGEDWEDIEEQLDVEERKKIELRIEREVWENDLREQRGLPPINRMYVETAGGAARTTADQMDAEDSADNMVSDQDREDARTQQRMEAAA